MNSGVMKMQQALLHWYDFKTESSILFIESEKSMVQFFCDNTYKLTQIRFQDIETMQKEASIYDYIIICNIDECKDISNLLYLCRKHIAEDGVLLVTANNRFGLKYFIGEKDPFTGNIFDGIEGYRECNANEMREISGRCYSKKDIICWLESVGFSAINAYAVLPDLESPQMIFAEGYIPNEELSIRFEPKYQSPETIFSKEEYLYKDLIKNDMFFSMANAYLFECALSKNKNDIQAVTLSLDRGESNSLATIVHKNYVAKKGIFNDVTAKFEKLEMNMQALAKRGIKTLHGSIENGEYKVPYVNGKTANVYLQELLMIDKEKYIEEMDRFRDIILKSSDVIRVDEKYGPIAKIGYIDLVPLNAIFADGDYVIIDQEFTEEEYPLNAIIYRAVAIVTEWDPRREAIVPTEFFWKRYGLQDQLDYWQKLSSEFIANIRNLNLETNKKYTRDDIQVYKNRFMLNHMGINYDYLFTGLTDNLENRKLFIFGSGKFADKFIAMYQKDFKIEGILDNNESKWGQCFQGYPVMNPDILSLMSPEEYKVIICIKDFNAILDQLNRLGTKYVSVYDKNRVYPGRQAAIIPRTRDTKGNKKKYHIGYIAGVFDLYHMGHLNMFMNAKEQCDYLIVGVVSDAGVRHFKNTEPYVPFDERIEMVRSCRYVDEAVEIPFLYRSTIEAFEKYHFDVQFSGSDYANDTDWLNIKKYLNENGADMVFFPYTQSTSSTKLKALIDKGLL